MQRPTIQAEGVVYMAPQLRDFPGQEPYVEFVLELEPRTNSLGRDYRERVYVRLFGAQGKAALTDIKLGNYVAVAGEADKKMFVAPDGRTFANLLVITGAYEILFRPK